MLQGRWGIDEILGPKPIEVISHQPSFTKDIIGIMKLDVNHCLPVNKGTDQHADEQ